MDCTNLFAKAQTLIPGGVNSPVRAFKAVGGTPLFFERAEGPYLYDVQQRPYIDYVGSWGCLILGHAHSEVLSAVHAAIDRGLGFGACTPTELEMATILNQCIPSIEQSRMLSSGTEATQTALRLARGYTRRNKIIKFQGCYHGHSDSLLVQAGSGLLTFGTPNSAGVPEAFVRHTLVASYNDLESVRILFEAFPEDIAGVIVEPIAANMNCVLPIPGFLEGLRALCDAYQSCLIFDEVITGFRVGIQGAQGLYGIKPDLTCLGKIIGGGLPIGALGGRREIMQCLAPQGPVYQAGTLSGNPITLRAGLSTLDILLKNPKIYSDLESHTDYFKTQLKDIADYYGIPLYPQGVGSLFGLFFTKEAATSPITQYAQVMDCNLEHTTKFFHGMLKEGIYFAPSAFEAGFISSAHTQNILDQTLEAAKRVFETWT